MYSFNMDLNSCSGLGNWSNNECPASIVLLQGYREKEELWNTKCELYKHTKSLQSALEDIASTLQEYIPNISSEDVKRQIGNLRTKYMNLKKKQSKKELNNETFYKPNLWCFDELSFLDEHIKNYNEETLTQKDFYAMIGHNSSADDRVNVDVEVNPRDFMLAETDNDNTVKQLSPWEKYLPKEMRTFTTKITTTSPTKRTSLDESTPSNSGNQQKRSKTASNIDGVLKTPEIDNDNSDDSVIPTHSVAPLKIAIVLENFPEDKLTEVQSEKIQAVLLKEVFKCVERIRPQFKKSHFDKGALIISCANEMSSDWLLKQMKRLKPLEGINLRAGAAKTMLRTKVLLKVSKLLSKYESIKLLEFLKNQNRGLRTQEWRVVSRRVTPIGHRLVLDIDLKSLEALKSNEYQAYLGITEVTFEVLSPQNDIRSPSSTGIDYPITNDVA